MASARPTLHESWYRVAELRPRLRPQVHVARQRFRDELWYVLRDPGSQRSFRLPEASYRFVGLLDGERTVDEAWVLAEAAAGDAAPTQGEAIALLAQLWNANLLDARLPGDAAALFERQQERRARERRRRLATAFFMRIPLWNPDRFLTRLEPLAGGLFSRAGVVLWLVLLGLGFAALAGRWDELGRESEAVLAPQNLVWLYLAIVGTKLLHEIGHGLAAKRFARFEGGRGGEVHTIGVLLVALLPIPYVDASASWAFRSKWRRAAVAAAGMYVELGVAAVAAIVWARTADGTLAHALSYNAILAAGVSTILFNANPLVRFDGYYIFSDLIEVPNLMPRSRERLQYLAKRYLMGVRQASDPARTPAEARGFVAYAVASLAYRVVLMTAIVLFVADQLFLVGAVLALMMLFALVVLPLWRAARYVAGSPELNRTRARAAAAVVVPVAALAAFALAVPLPDRGRAEGFVEPRPLVLVHAGAEGFVRALHPSGRDVTPDGAPLVRLENRELAMRKASLQAQRRALEVRRRVALARDIASLEPLLAQMGALDEELARVRADERALSVAAPVAGQWRLSREQALLGRRVGRGELLGLVAGRQGLRLRVAADQYTGPRVASRVKPGDLVRVRVQGRPEVEMDARVERVVAGGRRELPTPALGSAGGGWLEIRAEGEARETQAAEPFFEVWMVPATPEAEQSLRAGQRVVARFELGRAPLAAQAWRGARQLFQERFRI